MESPASATRILPVSCYGKLPFHREFLRLGLASASAAWIVKWLEQTHEAISRSSPRIETVPGETVRFWMPFADGATVVAGIVRQSSDGLRTHPVVLFTEQQVTTDAERWHLVPVALAHTWDALCAIVERQYGHMDELAAALAQGVGSLDLEAALSGYQEALSLRGTKGPWETLTGMRDDAAKHAGFNLLTVCQAQRAASRPDEGIAARAPLIPDEHSAEIRAGLWIELMGIVSSQRPLPAVLLTRSAPHVYAFYRSMTGDDLACALANDPSAIDDLAEPWQTLPSAESPLGKHLERLVAADTAPLGELISRVRQLATP